MEKDIALSSIFGIMFMLQKLEMGECHLSGGVRVSKDTRDVVAFDMDAYIKQEMTRHIAEKIAEKENLIEVKLATENIDYHTTELFIFNRAELKKLIKHIEMETWKKL